MRVRGAMNIYEELGGQAGVAPLVEDFYRRCIADEVLGAWFGSADIAALTVHLNAYLAVALGGPELYTGRSMRNAHSGLGVTPEAWDALLARFGEALIAAGVGAELIERVGAKIATLRAVIVEAQSRPAQR